MKNEQVRIFHGCVQMQGQILLDHWELSAYVGEVLGIVSLDNNELDAIFQVLTGQRSLDRGEFVYMGEKTVFRSTSDAMSCGICGIQRTAAIVRRENVADNIYTIPGGRLLGGWRKRIRSKTAAVPMIRYPRLLMRRRRADVIAREFLAKWGLSIDIRASAERLFRGEQLCVEVARAVLSGARVIVMNRIGNSCRIAPELLPKLFQQLKKLGITVVFEDNQLTPLAELSDRIMVVRDGMTEGVFKRGELKLAELTFLLTDRILSECYVRRTHQAGSPVLSVRLRSEMLNGSDELVLHEGEILGIRDLTEQKSREILRILSGNRRAGDGEINLLEKETVFHGLADAYRAGIAVIDGRASCFGLIPNEDLAVNLNYQRLQRFLRPARSGSQALLKLSFQEKAEAFGCTKEDYSKYPDQISVIQQFRLCLVRAEMMHARILVLISPSRHLDFVSRRQMCEWIDRRAESGMAVLILSSNASVLEDLCDRIYPDVLSDPKKIPQI